MEIPVDEYRAIIKFKDAENLDDITAVGDFLIDVCAIMDVHIILNPIVVDYTDENDETKSGVSAVVMFAESSMSIHTWPKLNYAAVDIYSCRRIDMKKITDAVNQYFSPITLEAKEVD
jgi:S-adenosylmethionine decarboxylase